MPREETANYYQSKVQEVIQYIENNLDQELTIKTLAERSNISLFHFHRIFKASVGTPLGTYINRLRLDAAAKLIRQSGIPIGEIALQIGYNDVSAFSKSFTRTFSISPTDYRQNRESTINSGIDLLWKNESIENFHLRPKIKVIPPIRAICIEVRGEYGGQETGEAWKALIDYASSNRLIGWNPDAFSIYYDDPDEKGIDNCTSDLCIAIRKNVIPDAPFKIKEIEGGKFLVFRYQGPYEKLWDVYNYLFKEHFILADNYKLRDALMLEKYIKYSEKTRPENLLTDICIPVE
ncbi:MAG: AraC family transcriptional regulator [Bacteroidales bacterium]|nr:AraC family transcriptional regulator [Bacteroidales bacterium]